jgi:hypothetical protein
MSDTSLSSRSISDSQQGSSYVEWSTIFAGAILASAIIVLMTAFGSAIGLSLISPYHGQSPVIFYVALALWFTWVTVSSFITGGYVTGRLRRPIEGTTPHEVHVRDGAHGLIVWAVAVVIGTALATFSLSSAVTTLSLSSAIKGSAELRKMEPNTGASGVGVNTDLMGYQLDILLRNAGKEIANNRAITRDVSGVEDSRHDASHIFVTGAAGGGLSVDERIELAHLMTVHAGLPLVEAEKRVDAILAQVKAAVDKVREATGTARRAGIALSLSVVTNTRPTGSEVDSLSREEESVSAVRGGEVVTLRQEIFQILSVGVANGSLSSDDRAYLIRLVSSRANLTMKDAEKRIDALFEQMKNTANNVRVATESTRKGGILLGFLTAATMVLGAAAAWFGAGIGGRHRDENFDASHLTRW